MRGTFEKIRKALLGAVLAAIAWAAVGAATPAAAQPGGPMLPPGVGASLPSGGGGLPGAAALSAPRAEHSWDQMFDGWDGFLDGTLVLDMAQVLLVAVVLGAAMAYHPTVRRKAASLEQLEQPKTFIMYSMVGALVAVLAKENATMAMVIFGIGGLLRFRTDVGEAKDTGRVILVTVVGLCCGLKLFVAAFLATGFGWLLTWYLEAQQITRIMIQGLDREHIGRASEAYRHILAQYGCKILGEKKNVIKGYITLVLRAPGFLDRDGLERYLEQVLPKEIRGSIDWDVA